MWVNKPNGRVFDFNIKLRFDRIQPRNLGRAAFTIRPVNSDQERASFATPVAHRRRIFKRLRDEVGSGRLGGADSSVSGSRIRLFESPRCLFVVQVRGSVVNCALPALNIDSYKHELSFEWRGLFSRFFGERKETAAVLHDAPVGHSDCMDFLFKPDLAAYRSISRQRISPTLIPIGRNRHHSLSPSIKLTQASKLLRNSIGINTVAIYVCKLKGTLVSSVSTSPSRPGLMQCKRNLDNQRQLLGDAGSEGRPTRK